MADFFYDKFSVEELSAFVLQGRAHCENIMKKLDQRINGTGHPDKIEGYKGKRDCLAKHMAYTWPEKE